MRQKYSNSFDYSPTTDRQTKVELRIIIETEGRCNCFFQKMSRETATMQDQSSRVKEIETNINRLHPS